MILVLIGIFIVTTIAIIVSSALIALITSGSIVWPEMINLGLLVGGILSPMVLRDVYRILEHYEAKRKNNKIS